MALVQRLEGAQVATRITQHQFAVVEIHLLALYARLSSAASRRSHKP
jgi:hypothetical protein